ncbi:MAG: sigma-70 family RNA polymerase sigma factor [Acidimicrobiia bacterium]|nr:sigma-70 family RNA polymerase sigma factor [Acidimicrobiia bacterium]
MTDSELVRAVADGNAAALRQLHERHAPWLAIRLSRRCSDPALVDEVVQDTFVSVWRSARRYRGEGDVGAWIWGIAIHRLVDTYRKSRLPLLERPGWVRSAEEEVLIGVRYGNLGDALNRLSPELMAVVQATILDGLSTREASHLLGIPVGTVKTRLMRAKRILREQLT